MVGRRRKQRSQQLAGNHQRCWIWGRNAVLQTLESGRWKPLELLAAERLDPALKIRIESLAQRASIPIEWTSFETLTGRCRSAEHQGLMAMMPEFPYRPLDDSLLPTGRFRFSSFLKEFRILTISAP